MSSRDAGTTPTTTHVGEAPRVGTKWNHGQRVPAMPTHRDSLVCVRRERKSRKMTRIPFRRILLQCHHRANSSSSAAAAAVVGRRRQTTRSIASVDGGATPPDNDDATTTTTTTTHRHAHRAILRGVHPEHMYRIINDVDSYRHFLPHCHESRVLRRSDCGTMYDAILGVGLPMPMMPGGGGGGLLLLPLPCGGRVCHSGASVPWTCVPIVSTLGAF